jgi:hypothetical protein
MSSKGKLGLEYRQEKIMEDDKFRMFEPEDFSEFEGRLLTLIESWGLQTNQETAIKSLVRKNIWQFWYEGIEPMSRKVQGGSETVFASENELTEKPQNN